MSKESVGRFYRAFAEDAALQRTFMAINDRLAEEFKDERPDEERMEEIFWNEMLPVARESGYEFSFQDLKEYAAESKRADELMDEELAAVAGGGDLCACVLAGYGTIGDVTLGCALYGGGASPDFFCFCFLGGGGKPK